MFNLDDLDRRIVRELQRDASQSNAELAERVGSSAPSCWRRIRQLEEAGVLKETVRLADPELLGQTVNVLCHVRMRSHDEDVISAFVDLVRSKDQIIECFSMSGEWDFIMRIVVSNVAEYERLLMGTLLKHPSVAGASSNFALSVTKYQTSLPVGP